MQAILSHTRRPACTQIQVLCTTQSSSHHFFPERTCDITAPATAEHNLLLLLISLQGLRLFSNCVRGRAACTPGAHRQCRFTYRSCSHPAFSPRAQKKRGMKRRCHAEQNFNYRPSPVCARHLVNRRRQKNGENERRGLLGGGGPLPEHAGWRSYQSGEKREKQLN